VAPTPTPTPTPAESTAATPTPAVTPTPTPTPSATELEPTSASAEPGDAAGSDDGGLPVWVPVLVILALFGAAGVVVVRRRSGA
jgi:hypothetical protein